MRDAEVHAQPLGLGFKPKFSNFYTAHFDTEMSVALDQPQTSLPIRCLLVDGTNVLYAQTAPIWFGSIEYRNGTPVVSTHVFH